MGQNSSELLNSFIEEAEEIFKTANEKIEIAHKTGDVEDFAEEMLRNLRIVEGNASALKIFSVQKLAAGLEGVFVALKDRRIKITERLIKLFELVSKKIVNVLNLVNDKIFFNDENIGVSIYLLYCEKIANGELVNASSMERDIRLSENLNLENEEDFLTSDGTIFSIHTIKVRMERLNEIVSAYDSLITKELRLKHQLDELKKIEDDTGLASISKVRKQLASEIDSFESQLLQMQQQVLDLRMLPLSIVMKGLTDVVKNAANENKKKVDLDLCETNLIMDKEILASLPDILSGLLKVMIKRCVELPEERLAAGKNETAKITGTVSADSSTAKLTLQVDGSGIDFDAVRKRAMEIFPEQEEEIKHLSDRELSAYLFRREFFSDDDELAKVLESVEKIKGKINIESEYGKIATFILRFPFSLAMLQGLFVLSGKYKLLIPSQHITDVVYRNKSEFISLQNQTCLQNYGELIPLYALSYLFDSSSDSFKENSDSANIIITEYMEQKIGLIVDKVLRYVSLPVKPLPPSFEKFSVMQGIVFDEHYDMVPILNMPDIITRFKAMRNYDMKKRVANDRNIVHKILCVDSSENARIIEQFALEKVGFVTETACDGIDALEKTKESRFDLIICANEMPRMNGMTLLENLRRSEVYKDVPFIVVFAEQNNELFEEYAENGANAWLDKSVFNRNEMIAKVKELLNA